MDVERPQGDPDPCRAPAHPDEGDSGRTGTAAPEARQAFAASDPQRALTVDLIEQACDPKNLLRA